MKEGLKLAIVRQRYNPFGGAERFVGRAMQALSAAGVDITLIAREWEGDAEAGTAFHRRICNPAFRNRVGRDRSFAQDVQAIIARREFDLVQSHERIPGCAIFRAGDGVHAAWLDRQARVASPLRRFAHRLDPYHRYVCRAEREMLSHPGLRAVICNSELVKGEMCERFPIDPAKIHVIYNGVDLDRFAPANRELFRTDTRRQLGIADEATVFLSVGSGFARKGVPQLLDAFAKLARPDGQLIVVGADRQLEKLRRRATTLGIGGRTHFTGGVRDVRPYYAAADVFALPTIYDPFPNAVLEAWASGLPVVTSDGCGAAELVREGENGFIVPAGTIDPLTAALEAASQPAHQMTAAAVRTVQDLSLDRMGQRLIGLYEQLLH